MIARYSKLLVENRDILYPTGQSSYGGCGVSPVNGQLSSTLRLRCELPGEVPAKRTRRLHFPHMSTQFLRLHNVVNAAASVRTSGGATSSGRREASKVVIQRKPHSLPRKSIILHRKQGLRVCTSPSYAPRSSRFGSEPPSVEDDVDVWRYAIVSCTPETTMTTCIKRPAVGDPVGISRRCLILIKPE